MTRLLKQAIARLQGAPDTEQDRLALLLLDEVDDDARWADTTAKHAPALERQLNELLKDDAGGQCETLDPDKL